jgi:hypothetical protein
MPEQISASAVTAKMVDTDLHPSRAISLNSLDAPAGPRITASACCTRPALNPTNDNRKAITIVSISMLPLGSLSQVAPSY